MECVGQEEVIEILLPNCIQVSRFLEPKLSGSGETFYGNEESEVFSKTLHLLCVGRHQEDYNLNGILGL